MANHLNGSLTTSSLYSLLGLDSLKVQGTTGSTRKLQQADLNTAITGLVTAINAATTTAITGLRNELFDVNNNFGQGVRESIVYSNICLG